MIGKKKIICIMLDGETEDVVQDGAGKPTVMAIIKH